MGAFSALLSRLAGSVFDPKGAVERRYAAFTSLLDKDRRCLALISRLETPGAPCHEALALRLTRLIAMAAGIVEDLRLVAPGAHADAAATFNRIAAQLSPLIQSAAQAKPPFVLGLGAPDVPAGQAGAKAARLAEARARGQRVPDGFVVTAGAFHAFVDENGLRPRIDSLLAATQFASPKGLALVCNQLARLILTARVPDAVAAELAGALADLTGRAPGPLSLAVRSSALFEDGEASFAGQYRSVLRVPPKGVLAAYKAVLASKYSPRAVVYRNRLGLSDTETAMAVLVMPMTGGRLGGVAHSLDPEAGGRDVLAVYAVPGAGARVVDGTAVPAALYFERGSPPALVGGCDGELCRIGEFSTWILPDEADAVAGLAMDLEREFGRPQDVEWAMGEDATPWLLQTRDLPAAALRPPPPTESSAPMPTPLYAGGTMAVAGRASGQSFHLRREADMAEVPAGCVLIAKSLWPSLSLHVDKLRGVVAETGSRAGHFAIVAAEFGVPVLAGARDALALIPPGKPVTLDAGAREVYPGRLTSLAGKRLGRAPSLPPTVKRRLDEVARLASHLNFTGEADAHGSPSAVASIHDLIRYCHEQAIQGMFGIGGKLSRISRKASLPAGGLPLSLRLIDVGGGLAGGESGPDQSVPPERFGPLLGALCDGMRHPLAAKNAVLPQADFHGLAEMAEGGVVGAKGAALDSYAMLAGEHLHLQAKFGFHFAVLDCHLGTRAEQNYIGFSFKGGGGLLSGRMARLGLMVWILEREGFRVTVSADLLRAKLPRPALADGLRALGLIGFALARTRLLDMAPDPKAAVELAAIDFRTYLDQTA